jgi:hypothetical protein
MSKPGEHRDRSLRDCNMSTRTVASSIKVLFMRQGRRYRITTPTMAILTTKDGPRTSLTVPSGAVITVSEDSIDGDRLIDVVWDGKAYLMFTQDLRERATPVTLKIESPETTNPLS